ncbi:MAG: manganese efflux pump [Marinobacter sp.]|uniref:manganese efflux pump n=1 Tax=Marinobacter sp. TaxID=50741 RepID=UPI003F9B3D17
MLVSGLAFVNVNIWLAAVLIGIATITMVTIGIMLVRAMDSMLGKKRKCLAV